MPFALESLTQGLALLGATPPQQLNPGTDLTTINLDLSKVRRLLVVIQVGVFGASATVDAKLRAAKTSGGAYADIPGAAITQMLAAGGNNKIATIEVRDDQLNTLVGAGYQFVELSLTVGTAPTFVSALALGAEAEYKPAKSQNIAAVTQQIVT